MTDTPQPASQVKGTKVGKITHFFDKIMVAVVELESGALKVGDTIQVVDKDGTVVVEQKVDSMQIDKANIEEAKVGEPFGMKVAAAVAEGMAVNKV